MTLPSENPIVPLRWHGIESCPPPKKNYHVFPTLFFFAFLILVKLGQQDTKGHRMCYLSKRNLIKTPVGVLYE